MRLAPLRNMNRAASLLSPWLLFACSAPANSGTLSTTEATAEHSQRPVYDLTGWEAVPDLDLIPPELADADALRHMQDWRRLPLFDPPGRYVQESSRDRGHPDPAEEMLLPVIANGNRDTNNFVCRSADAVIDASQLLAPRYDLERCPEAYAKGVVLARYEGSGRLVRLWMTALSFESAPPDDEILRIYVDDDPRPRLQLPLAQAMSGQAGEMFARPFGAESNVWLAWYYPVVFGQKLVVALDRLGAWDLYYHQTDVVLDDPTAQRHASASRLPERDVALTQLRASSPTTASEALAREHVSLAAGTQQRIPIVGPATIQTLRLRVPRGARAALERVQLGVRWDAASAPAIALPLLQLFVANRAVVDRASLALAAHSEGDDQVIELRLPMPFRTQAEWTLDNSGPTAANFQLEWLGELRAPETPFGYLHVQASDAVLPTQALERTIVSAQGRGRLVGICADLAGHADAALGVFQSALNLLEADVRATADGSLALDTTGTEDYADNAFYFAEAPYATPFAQSWGLVNDVWRTPPGQVSFCRWHVLGSELDFRAALSVNFELGSRNPSTVDKQHALAFLYQ